VWTPLLAFHYSFAQASGGLATTYAGAGTSSSASFSYNDNGTFTVFGRIFDKDGGFTDYTTTITVNNVAPTATIQQQRPISAGGGVAVALTNPVDPSSVDTSAGFHCSFAQSSSGLASTYAAAGNQRQHHLHVPQQWDLHGLRPHLRQGQRLHRLHHHDQRYAGCDLHAHTVQRNRRLAHQ